MPITLKQRRPGARLKNISDVSSDALASLHEDWVEFLRTNDGAVPETNEFDVGAECGSGVQTFYSVSQVKSARRRLIDRLPPDLLPIADAEGGNLVCLGLSRARHGVFFWDHETETCVPLANTFSEFLDGLKAFDVDAVELRPGQVVSAWIDPELLEREKK